jgi:pectate lyase
MRPAICLDHELFAKRGVPFALLASFFVFACGSATSPGTSGSGGAAAGGEGGTNLSGAGGVAGAAGAGVGGATPGGGGSGGTPGQGGASGGAGAAGARDGGAGAAPSVDAGCNAPPEETVIGWASVAGAGVTTTTGGAGGPTVTVTTLAQLNARAGGTAATIIQVMGTISGSVRIGSNKTIVGVCGGGVQGHLGFSASSNVIVRNLAIVGNNCTDSPTDCSAGADAVTVGNASHHIWFDHDDISDGSDGNLDMTEASDFITISWTKFHYSARRVDPAGAGGGHEFSNLISGADNALGDVGHLKITFHHDWWADNVYERMPRARFGQLHIFNNLYTSAGNLYCIGAGVAVNILNQNNVFVGVTRPIDTTSFADPTTIVQSIGNIYTRTTGAAPRDLGGPAFTPPYPYMLDDATTVQAAVTAGAGPR